MLAVGAAQSPLLLPGTDDFDPRSVADQVLFRSDRISGLIDNDPISTWPDVSLGAAADATASGTQRPTYRTGVVPIARFDGSLQWMAATGQSMNIKPFTIWGVVKPDVVNSFLTIVGPSAAGGVQLRVNSAAKLELLKAGVASIGASNTNLTAAWLRFVVTYDSSGNFAFYRNNVAEGSGTSNQTFSASTLRLGHGTDTNPERWDGDMEIIGIHSAVITAEVRQRLFSWMASATLIGLT